MVASSLSIKMIAYADLFLSLVSWNVLRKRHKQDCLLFVLYWHFPHSLEMGTRRGGWGDICNNANNRKLGTRFLVIDFWWRTIDMSSSEFLFKQCCNYCRALGQITRKQNGECLYDSKELESVSQVLLLCLLEKWKQCFLK